LWGNIWYTKSLSHILYYRGAVKNEHYIETSKERDIALHQRLSPFLDAGLLLEVPNRWQRLQGMFEMAPYVVIPDEDDDERYEGAPMGNPLLRTPLVLAYIGPDHFRIGSGLGAKPRSVIRHLCIVHHQVMPDYDLQLLQTHEQGLDQLERYLKEIDEHRPRLLHRLHRRIIDAVLPDAREYRNEFIKTGGWLERARDMEYTQDADMPAFLRKEFFSLTRFLDYCTSLPQACSALRRPGRLLSRMGIRFRGG
jgi:hypothetical protein